MQQDRFIRRKIGFSCLMKLFFRSKLLEILNDGRSKKIDRKKKKIQINIVQMQKVRAPE